MLAAVALLLAADDPPGTAATQARLDQLVHRCAAEKVVQLKARSADEVVIEMPHNNRAQTPAEERQYSCVLTGLQQMPELKLGFIGNEESER